MNKKIIMLLAACVGLAVFLAAVLLYDRIFEKNLQEQLATTQGFEMPTTTAPPPTTKPGDQVADFVLTDAEGNTVNLSDLKGKPMVILFWASWNADSTAGISYLESLKKEQGDAMHVLLIDLADGEKETVEAAKQWLADKNYACPVYFDDGTVAKKFSTTQVPMTFFLNAEGVAKAYIKGAIDQAAMDRGLSTIVPEETEN